MEKYYFTFSFVNEETTNTYGITHAENPRQAMDKLNKLHINWSTLYTAEDWKKIRK